MECDAARCPSPEAEAAAPHVGASTGCQGQEVSPRSSPDTNSPVMVNVEVRHVQITATHSLIRHLTSDCRRPPGDRLRQQQPEV